MDNRCSALFHWDTFGYQIRVRGTISKSPEEESNNYFATRDLSSQISAWASNQSQNVEDRKSMDNRFQKIMEKFDIKDKDLKSSIINVSLFFKCISINSN